LQRSRDHHQRIFSLAILGVFVFFISLFTATIRRFDQQKFSDRIDLGLRQAVPGVLHRANELGESQIPGLMDGLTSQVTSSAPSIIQEAEDQLEGTLTSLRQQLQQSIGDGMGEAISNIMVDHDSPIMTKLKARPGARAPGDRVPRRSGRL
jgi:hypothetical protein